MEDSVNDIGLHRLFFERIPAIYEEMNKDIWRTLGRTAGQGQNARTYLPGFLQPLAIKRCTIWIDSEFWHYALQGEAAIRHFLVENRIQIVKGEEFEQLFWWMG